MKVKFIDASEAPRPPRNDGRGLTLTRNIDRDTKRCRTCNRILPFRLFLSTGSWIKSLGRKCGSADCRDCLERKRRAAGVPKRMTKVDGRGRVWCSNCKRYLPSTEFKPHPNRNKPGKQQQWWAYCKPCTRELDRLRYRGNVATPEGRRRVMEKRTKRHRRQSANEMRERREFLAGAIDLLLHRGLTLSEIARVVDCGLTSLYDWRAKRIGRPTNAVVSRFEQLLRLTMDWPQVEPAYRRRLPHPRLPELMAAMAPVIAANPVRSRWKARTAGADREGVA